MILSGIIICNLSPNSSFKEFKKPSTIHECPKWFQKKRQVTSGHFQGPSAKKTNTKRSFVGHKIYLSVLPLSLLHLLWKTVNAEFFCGEKGRRWRRMLWSNESSQAAQMSLRECKFPVSLDNYINQNILQPYWLIHTLIIYVGAALQWHRFIYFSPERKTLHANLLHAY